VLHLRAGDRRGAARVYARLGALLRSELGCEPRPETQRWWSMQAGA